MPRKMSTVLTVRYLSSAILVSLLHVSFSYTDGSDSEILFHGLLIYLSLELGLYGGFESEGEDAQAHDAR